MTKQAHLFSDGQPGKAYTAKGPVFDKKNYKKYLLKNVIIGLVIFGGAVGSYFAADKILNWYRKHGAVTPPTAISEVITTNDSQTKIARRAVTDYLNQHSDIKLSPAQRLFIETSLVQTHKGSRLQVGGSVEFKIADLQSLVTQSQNLSAFQLQAWSTLARGIQF